MPRHEEQRVLPYSRELLFDIISDVASYPEFLPWCTSARIYKRRGDKFLADLVVGFKMVNESWTSEVEANRPYRVVSNYIKGPMKYLRSRWILNPHAEGTLIDFSVDFEFKNPFLTKLIGPLFEEANHKMMAAFEQRARELSKKTP